MFIVLAQRRHIFHAGTRAVTEQFPAILINLLEELAQVNTHRANGNTGPAIHAASDHMIQTHKLKYLCIGFVFADTYPLRLTLFHKAGRAVAGRTGLTAGVATHAFFHFLGKIGPALFNWLWLQILSRRYIQRRDSSPVRLPDHDIGNNGIVETAGKAAVRQNIFKRHCLIAVGCFHFNLSTVNGSFHNIRAAYQQPSILCRPDSRRRERR